VHLKAEFFERWTALFTDTVDEMFAGEKASLAKQRAISIAVVMQIKITTIQQKQGPVHYNGYCIFHYGGQVGFRRNSYVFFHFI
jgi:hypothetical protein